MSDALSDLKKIVEIHNIASAPGWYFDDCGDYKPVACFALVTVENSSPMEMPEPTKRVIAFDAESMLSDLVEGALFLEKPYTLIHADAIHAESDKSE